MSLSDDLQTVTEAAARLSLRAKQIHRQRHPLPLDTIAALRGEAALLRSALDNLDAALAVQAPMTDPGPRGPLPWLVDPDPHIDLGETAP